ncbi:MULTISPECIES: cupin domain-containing protein [unclassified Pseudomonas]|uniref:cupin domain-containing protein n=1 Tax=unclassified Pseudomonas TaxID=196821 RepID=UPI00111C5329|nr:MULTISPECIES: cupin domain-containing protein [unclassified Pseudomonas]
MTIDRDESSKYSAEYDVSVRRLSDLLALTSAKKEAMGAAMVEFYPGETIREHINKENVEEIFLLLDGTADFTLDGVVHSVKAGDVAFAKIGQSHSFKNTSTDKARLFSLWWKAVSTEQVPA